MLGSVVKCYHRMPRLFRHRIILWNIRCLSTQANVKRSVFPVQNDTQSVILAGEERIRASKLLEDPYQLLEYVDENIRTVYDVLHHGFKVSEDGECLGTFSKQTKRYEWIKYSEVIKRSEYLGSALISVGMKPKNDSYIGIYSKNRTECVLTNMGCTSYSMVSIPIYDTLGTDGIQFIINQVELSVIVCDTVERAISLVNQSKKIPTLKQVIVMDPITEELYLHAKSKNIDVFPYSEFEKEGKLKRIDPVPPKPEDLYAISYTSGTTGFPKGVMLTHGNIISCIDAVMVNMGQVYSFGKTILSYLPSAHIYEICNQASVIHKGGKVGFYTGDIKEILSDTVKLKPSIMPLVPRLMNRVFTTVLKDLRKNPVKRQFWNFALKQKEKQLKCGILKQNTVWDKIFFEKIHGDLGGNLMVTMCTSAPVSPDVMRFFRLASGGLVFEVYGQTEACAVTKTLPYETEGGFVGPPLPCNHIKLIDVPEMGYFAKDDTGEVCVRGPNVCKGYFKNPVATKEAIDVEGWLHTGDIGKWLPNGALSIIDRKKHLLKLSQGEYVAPEKVENVYSQCDSVLQIYVDGLSTEDYLVCIVVPEESTFKKWAKRKNFDTSDYKKLCCNEKVRITLLKKLHKIGIANGLNSLEQIRNIHLLPDPMTVDDGLITPTLKLRRGTVKKHFALTIEMLYKEGPLLESLQHLKDEEKTRTVLR